jgi:hypothetical protein
MTEGAEGVMIPRGDSGGGAWDVAAPAAGFGYSFAASAVVTVAGAHGDQKLQLGAPGGAGQGGLEGAVVAPTARDLAGA